MLITLLIIVIQLAMITLIAPKAIRSIDREQEANCRVGNSPKFCKENHPHSCRFGRGVRKNIDGSSLALGLGFAFFWFLTLPIYGIYKLASRPDKAQTLTMAENDEKEAIKIEKYGRMLEQRELERQETEIRLALRTKAANQGVRLEDLKEEFVKPEPVKLSKQDIRKAYKADFVRAQQEQY